MGAEELTDFVFVRESSVEDSGELMQESFELTLGASIADGRNHFIEEAVSSKHPRRSILFPDD